MKGRVNSLSTPVKATCNVQLLFEDEDEEEQKVTDSRLRNTQHSTLNVRLGTDHGKCFAGAELG